MDRTDFEIVIIGAGHAGVELASSLRQHSFPGSIALISDEPDLPYQRPPLSKDHIKRPAGTEALMLKPASFFIDNAIDLELGISARSVNRADQIVTLSDGRALQYRQLVFATGARNRKPPIPGLDDSKTLELRTLADANSIVGMLADIQSVVVIGGGFIGLEAASLLRGKGLKVDVVEMAPRLMQRAVSPRLSAWFLQHHREEGSVVHLGTTVEAIRHGDRPIVEVSGGQTIEADAVLLAAGIVPNVELAQASGLATDNGILVDSLLQTEDPAVSAIGDCAAYPSVHMGEITRLESVQNATDQARALAARLTGEARPYDSLPWFWSIQGDARLQIAGLARPGLTEIIRGSEADGRFSVFLFNGDRLVAVESVNSPADHMAARRLIGQMSSISPAQAADSAVSLKELIAG